MKKVVFTLLAPLTLMGNPCCQPPETTSCYPYGLNLPLISNPCCVWGAHIDFLYWHPSADQNPFAYIVSSDLVATLVETTPISGNYSTVFKEYRYDYEAGFRVGVDGGLPCNGWALGLDWTHFLHDATGIVSANAPHQVALSSYLNIGQYVPLDNGTLFADSSVNSALRIQLDVIDLAFSREFYVGHQVTLRPYGGLRGLLLRQNVEATNIISGGGLGLSYEHSDTHLNAKANFKGIGLLGGLSTTWDFLCNFGFYTDLTASFFYGKSNSSLDGTITNTGLALGENLSFLAVEVENNFNATRFALDFALGIQWRKELFASKSLVCLRAGWEEHLFFNQNTFTNLTLDEIFLNSYKKPASDISFQGLVVSASFTY